MVNRSVFPHQVDDFQELFDLPPDKVVKAKRLQELKQKPILNSLEQNELNGLVVELSDFIITPEHWNKFADALVNVQKFFNAEVKGYILSKQKEWDSYILGFTYKNTYLSSVQYRKHNMVNYGDGLWLCVKDAKGITPSTSNSSYWQKISAKGDKGDVGLNTHLKGDFSTTATYAVGDAVRFQGRIYYCIKATTAGTSPSTDTTGAHWVLDDNMIISKTKPTNPQTNMIWIEVLD